MLHVYVYIIFTFIHQIKVLYYVLYILAYVSKFLYTYTRILRSVLFVCACNSLQLDYSSDRFVFIRRLDAIFLNGAVETRATGNKN